MFKKLIAFYIFIEGILLIVGPSFIFTVCKSQEKGIMRCNISAKVIIVMGIISVVISVFLFFSKTKREAMHMILLNIVISVLTLLVPLYIVGGCSMKTMQCRAISFPIVYLLCLISTVLSILFVVTDIEKRGLKVEI